MPRPDIPHDVGGAPPAPPGSCSVLSFIRRVSLQAVELQRGAPRGGSEPTPSWDGPSRQALQRVAVPAGVQWHGAMQREAGTGLLVCRRCAAQCLEGRSL
jgi:hypothetical protein